MRVVNKLEKIQLGAVVASQRAAGRQRGDAAAAAAGSGWRPGGPCGRERASVGAAGAAYFAGSALGSTWPVVGRPTYTLKAS